MGVSCPLGPQEPVPLAMGSPAGSLQGGMQAGGFLLLHRGPQLRKEAHGLLASHPRGLA